MLFYFLQGNLLHQKNMELCKKLNQICQENMELKKKVSGFNCNTN